MSNELITENVSVLARAEIDSQVATAKAYPRNIKQSISKAVEIATFSQNIAESCIYSIPRGGKTISGPSIRLAEIMISVWQNIHCSTRVVSNNGKFISVEAIVIDRESNNVYAETIDRSIMTSAKNGKTPSTFSFDMQQTTAAAAASIALRKAAFRLIPKQFVEIVYEEAKKVAVGGINDLSKNLEKAIAAFERSGFTRNKILDFFEVKSIEALTQENLAELIGIKNAIVQGDLSREHAFDKAYTGEVIEDKTKANELNDKFNLSENKTIETKDAVIEPEVEMYPN